MGNDLISRKDALSDIDDICTTNERELVIKSLAHTMLLSRSMVPTIDAAPVVHGRWISYPECLAFEGAYHDEHIVCSACHSVWNIIDNDTERFDYCPNCGAKMDGERREDK